MAVHTWHTSPDTDDEGFRILQKHLVVEFVLEGISDLELIQFSHQNVTFGLDIKKKNDGFALTLAPCYGLAGIIEVSNISISLQPGKP